MNPTNTKSAAKTNLTIWFLVWMLSILWMTFFQCIEISKNYVENDFLTAVIKFKQFLVDENIWLISNILVLTFLNILVFFKLWTTLGDGKRLKGILNPLLWLTFSVAAISNYAILSQSLIPAELSQYAWLINWIQLISNVVFVGLIVFKAIQNNKSTINFSTIILLILWMLFTTLSFNNLWIDFLSRNLSKIEGVDVITPQALSNYLDFAKQLVFNLIVIILFAKSMNSFKTPNTYKATTMLKETNYA